MSTELDIPECRVAPCYKSHLAGKKRLQIASALLVPAFSSQLHTVKETLFHVIFISIMFLPHDFPLLFCSYGIALGFPKFPCCSKALCRTGVQGLLHSQATKVSLTFLLVPVAPGLVACRWSIWPPTRACVLPYELSSHLCLLQDPMVHNSHGEQRRDSCRLCCGDESVLRCLLNQGWH